MLDGMSDSIQGSRIENLHSREVDRQSPTGLIFVPLKLFYLIRVVSWLLVLPRQGCHGEKGHKTAVVVGAKLMHKHGAHGCTDVTGFGILGHASNLAAAQKNAVNIVIHQLPVIRNMISVAEACGIKFGLLQGRSAETSGILLVSAVLVIICISFIAIFLTFISVHLTACPNCLAVMRTVGHTVFVG